MEDKFSRRSVLYSVSMLAAGTTLAAPLTGFGMKRKLKVVLVGTGVRGTSFWGKRLVDEYSDILEFVGLSDINPGRLAYGKEYMNVNCPIFVDFDEMSKRDMDLYVENEEYDGYMRDGCVYRNEIDIYDKMSANIKYANKAVVNYSLTTYSPFEGWKIAFNGQKGRIDAWLDIPFLSNETMDQEALHAAEMDQNLGEDMNREPLVLHKNWEESQMIQVVSERGGHGGGDKRLHDKIFKNPDAADPYKHSAGIRDGIMSVLIGVAARNSIHSNQPVRIEDLTDIKPNPNRA
ncbi:MAG: Gfo/Idh/MocA family oxidoreductase [Cyclobacteriaceae bacterium]